MGGQAAEVEFEQVSGGGGSIGLGRPRELLEELGHWVGALETGALTTEAAAEVLELAASIERLGSGLRCLVVQRALAGADWEGEGYRSPAAWLAETARCSVPQAVASLNLAGRLERLPATADALRRGTLSETEATVLATAAAGDPTAEDELLEAARLLPMRQFCSQAREVARTVRQADPDHGASLHRRRYLRFWTDMEGALRLSGGLSPDEGVRLLAAVRSRAAHVADEARRAGLEQESPAAYDADALVSLALGDDRRASFDGPEAPAPPRKPSVVLHVSVEALRRGRLEPGECCEIPGVGPVPLQSAEGLLGDALLSVVVEDGVDVRSVAHVGRCVPTHLRSALEARDPSCVVPGCSVSLGLETDHWQVPFADGGATELWNLARLCRAHHRMKTYEGLCPGRGSREMGVAPTRLTAPGMLSPWFPLDVLPPRPSSRRRPTYSPTEPAWAIPARADGPGRYRTAPMPAGRSRPRPISAWRSLLCCGRSRAWRAHCWWLAIRPTW